jgi:hypothetical protein
MSKPKADQAVRQIRDLTPNLVQRPAYFSGGSQHADVWLRKSADGSEVDAMAIEVDAAASPQTQATLGKWAGIPTATVDAAVQQARALTTSQPSQRQAVPGGMLTVTRFPNSIAIRVDFT